MKTEEEETTPRTSSGSGKGRKVKKKLHNHIGPNVRAFRAGRAFCPVCDADKALRQVQQRDAESDDFARTRKSSR